MLPSKKQLSLLFQTEKEGGKNGKTLQDLLWRRKRRLY